MKKEIRKFGSGLAVNRNKSYIQEIPHYRFTEFGKLANGAAPDIIHTVQILDENLKDKLQDLSAGELKAIITISEMSFQLIKNYTQKTANDLLPGIKSYLKTSQGLESYFDFLELYRINFLKLKYEHDNETHSDYLISEIIINWMNNINPAFKPYYPLFDNSQIIKESGNFVIMQELINCIRTEVPEDGSNNTKNRGLYQLLREPALRFPDSIKAQLEYILESWSDFLDDTTPILQSLDLMKEEEKQFTGGFGHPPVLDYKSLSYEDKEENYSKDTDWMPSLVLLAKSSYVWLHQLSLKYGYSIRKLDQVPDTELELYRKRGITGLWLIGIWQRSYASEKIKSRNGDQQAIASAYSLESYRIADDLGGEDAWNDLTHRAGQCGIRLGCDMVPNHTGIDSEWIVHHPQWFLQRERPPYPSYHFTGENLSRHPEVEVRIEDHYYAKTDAAVVFELHDRRDDSRRYIYHGNDGTGLPWNDTAQLDYTQEAVRQAVLQEIVNIAREIPIIRFDAAMTLAKKHYQRLWFPVTGTGGDIPSRSEYSMTKQEFDQVFPREFWRDVVDSIAAEVPDTLLLAEAFWMMEGYFVRNLGMHRVYNSAFMHMMLREDNASFRRTIYNTLEYDKRILKRFVNFMSNPDEETAIGQFGDDDKYFGVCVMMCTLPGLPMFGHGQMEGFREKYGMEFASPRMMEIENQYLIRRHEKEIFPILKRRKVFAEADNFRLFDFRDNFDNLNENVMAFSNYNLDTHSLVVYNNSFERTKGRIFAAGNYDLDQDNNIEITTISLGEILGLHYGPDRFIIFHDMVTNLEYLRYCDEILTSGFELELNGYEYHVFADFKEVLDNDEHKLNFVYKQLGKNGTDSIESMKKRIILRPLHEKLMTLFSYSMISNQELLIIGDLNDPQERKFFLEHDLFPAILEFHSTFMEMENFIPWTKERLINNNLTFFKNAELVIIRRKPACRKLPPSSLIAAWTLLREIRIRAVENQKDIFNLIDKYLLHEPLQEIFAKRCPGLNPRLCLDIVYICLQFEDFWTKLLIDEHKLSSDHPLSNDVIINIIHVHEYNGVRWFNQEAFDILFSSLELVNRLNRAEGSRNKLLSDLNMISEYFSNLYNLALKSEYNYDKLLSYLMNGSKEI